MHTLQSLCCVVELQHSNNSFKGLCVDFCIMLHELRQLLLGGNIYHSKTLEYVCLESGKF